MRQRQSSVTTATHWPERSIGARSRGLRVSGAPGGCAGATPAPTAPESSSAATFRVREKHVAATMDGDTSGELYSIDDVPYILYFHASYAVHGAFWHEEFGRVRSHGCVNLSPPDAKRVFFWSDPPVPQGWHAVWSDAEHPGTIVVSRP